MGASTTTSKAYRTREEEIKLTVSAEFDLLIIGGGVQGAFLLREAVTRGYKVCLLEKHDYAYQASSRSSKMLHGGIRYLEQADFRLIREALVEQKILLETAPHLTRMLPFIYPIVKGKTRPSWQVRIGLLFYDFLAGRLFTPYQHKKLELTAEENKQLVSLGFKSDTLYQYFDGQMDDARLVIEAIVDARNEGAVALNYAAVERAEYDYAKQMWKVCWRCQETKIEYHANASFVINAAGQNVAEIHKIFVSVDSSYKQSNSQVLFSRGAHLIFKQAWHLPGVILPAEKAGRYYFIWPYRIGVDQLTLVGTTDIGVTVAEEDPRAVEQEVNLLLMLLQRDFPNSGLTHKNLIKTFCGTRVLAKKKSFGKQDVTKVSRRHTWLKGENILSLVGGKYTTARAVADEGISCFEKTTKRPRTNSSTKARKFPGAMEEANIQNDIWDEKSFDQAMNKAILLEQSRTLEDILRRRLGLSIGLSLDIKFLERINIKLSENTSREMKALSRELEFYLSRWQDLASYT